MSPPGLLSTHFTSDLNVVSFKQTLGVKLWIQRDNSGCFSLSCLTEMKLVSPIYLLAFSTECHIPGEPVLECAAAMDMSQQLNCVFYLGLCLTGEINRNVVSGSGACLVA